MPTEPKTTRLALLQGKPWAVTPLVIALLLLDGLRALQGVPLLVLTIIIAFLAGDGFPRLLRRKELQPLAQVGALVASLILLLAFCYQRSLPQLLLLLVTAGVVVSILFVVLAFIGEASKRGLKGLRDCFLMAGFGLFLGALLSGLLFLRPGPPGGSGRAAP